jgi:hypothetical protein
MRIIFECEREINSTDVFKHLFQQVDIFKVYYMLIFTPYSVNTATKKQKYVPRRSQIVE